jgi:hypothetical protein
MQIEDKMDPPDVEPYLKLIEAALSKIDGGYFKLSTTYEPSGIVRERAFCYELYHLIRTMMDDDDPLSLNGEIDKRGHPDFAEEDRKNPDFVFHIPDTHWGNAIAIEVKGTLDRVDEIIGDISTLLTLVEKYYYKAGVFILYNHSQNELRKRMQGMLQQFSKREGILSIYILTITGSREAPVVALLSDFIN